MRSRHPRGARAGRSRGGDDDDGNDDQVVPGIATHVLVGPFDWRLGGALTSSPTDMSGIPSGACTHDTHSGEGEPDDSHEHADESAGGADEGNEN
jgi:hypothetical protein